MRLDEVPLHVTTTLFAAGALIVIGAIIAILGVFSAGSPLWAVIGLGAILAGGGLGLAAQRRR